MCCCDPKSEKTRVGMRTRSAREKRERESTVTCTMAESIGKIIDINIKVFFFFNVRTLERSGEWRQNSHHVCVCVCVVGAKKSAVRDGGEWRDINTRDQARVRNERLGTNSDNRVMRWSYYCANEKHLNFDLRFD